MRPFVSFVIVVSTTYSECEDPHHCFPLSSLAGVKMLSFLSSLSSLVSFVALMPRAVLLTLRTLRAHGETCQNARPMIEWRRSLGFPSKGILNGNCKPSGEEALCMHGERENALQYFPPAFE